MKQWVPISESLPLIIAQPCSSEQNGQIFLWNMTSVVNTPEGLVFVCDNGLWRRICDDMWTDEDAIVACRELGFSDKGEIPLIFWTLFVVYYIHATSS